MQTHTDERTTVAAAHPSQVLQLASRFGYSPNTLGAPNAAASAALFDWRACMSAALGDGHDEIDRRAAAELASLCTAAHRWALSFSEPGSLSHEALCSVFPTHPAAEAGPHQGTPPFTGHPVLHGTTLLRLAARGDAERTRMLRMMQCLDRGHLGTLPLEDVVYTVVAFAPSSSGTPIARGDREALAATFPGPEIRGLAAKVLGQDRQCDFAALVRSLSPMRGDVEVDKARCGCRTWASPSTGELRDEGDPVAAMVRMSSVVFRDYLELGRALENLEAPDGTVSAADVAVAARSSLGLSLTGAEEAWLERHLGVDPASMGPGRRIPATRLMTAVYGERGAAACRGDGLRIR